jgi:hypothetical protein
MAELSTQLIDLGKLLANLAGDLLFLCLYLVVVLLRWSPVIVWVAWWLWAVDWRQLGPALARGAWAPLVLLAIITAIVWSALFPGQMTVAGLLLPHFWGHLAVVGLAAAVAGLCGWLQVQRGWGPPEVVLEPAAGHGEAHVHHDGHTHH